MDKIVLTYPKDFPDLDSEVTIVSVRFGLFAQGDLANKKIHISSKGGGHTLESVFTKNFVKRLKEGGVEVEVK